jgi:hypothetical protein
MRHAFCVVHVQAALWHFKIPGNVHSGDVSMQLVSVRDVKRHVIGYVMYDRGTRQPAAALGVSDQEWKKLLTRRSRRLEFMLMDLMHPRLGDACSEHRYEHSQASRHKVHSWLAHAIAQNAPLCASALGSVPLNNHHEPTNDQSYCLCHF